MIKPFYEDEWVTLYCGDSIELMQGLPNESVDLLCTDPPYGIEWKSNHRNGLGFDKIHGDESTAMALAGLLEGLRVLRDHRHMYAFGRYDFTGFPLGQRVELIWDKGIGSFAGHGTPWSGMHEYIQFAVKCPSKANREKGAGNAPARLRKGTVLRYDRLNSTAVKDHPTPKPVALMQDLIESSSNRGETVLEPFAGGGATLVAARLEQRKCIAFEINRKFCDDIARRLGSIQDALFDREDQA